MNVPTDVCTILSNLGVGRRFYDDPFFESNKTLDEMKKTFEIYETDRAESNTSESITCSVPGCLFEFKSMNDSDAHYNSVHRYKCCTCKKSLPTSHLLDLHIAENHDSFFAVLAEEQPSYACFLETCKIKFSNPAERKDHCLKVHKFPHNFRFDHRYKKDFKKKNLSHKSTVSSEKSLNSDISDKPKTFNFNFSHSKQRCFKDSAYTGKKFIDENKPKDSTKPMDYEEMIVDLKENLPET